MADRSAVEIVTFRYTKYANENYSCLVKSMPKKIKFI